MNIICSPNGIIHPPRPAQGVMDLASAGFKNIVLDFSMRCSGYELEHYGEENEDKDTDSEYAPVTEDPSGLGCHFEKMLASCREHRLHIPVARAPHLLRDTKRTDLTALLMRIHKECIKLCGQIGCGKIIIRPLFAGLSWGQEWEANRMYYLDLACAAREHNVKILLENQCRFLNGHLIRGICSDASMAAKWVDALNEEAGDGRFGFCMDVGACSLCGQDMHEYARALGHRIQAVILRDCDGYQESSLLPFTCARSGQPRTDWLGLIRGLREAGFDGELILAMADTASVFSPLLRPHLMSLARATAEYFKWQIGIENLLKKYRQVVLFGAGNMCRNYMKCYGEKYPPLFTCDNNQKVWGSRFCGLEVKPPEALKALPEDCGIFICNIYYREIEKQLKGMGIKNPVEYFNDEYMPSFYFDRLNFK